MRPIDWSLLRPTLPLRALRQDLVEYHLAGRHIALANGLLKETPNLWLDASARLTNAIVFSVQGDLQTACELAEAAGRDAARAGWLKGEAVAAANLAYFHACAGRIAESKRYIGQASSIGYLPPSYACALLDTRTIVAFADSDFSEADRLWSEGQESVGRVAYWYWMRCAHTRVRGLIRQDRFPEALEIAQKYKNQADQLRNNYFSYVFGLSIAQLEANNGRPIHLPTDVVAPSDCSLGLIGARKQVLAQVLVQAESGRAAIEMASAHRILEAAGCSFEWGAIESPGDVQDMPGPGLDDAVAFIELAGYPHVLAREAYALLEHSKAAEALALVARGDQTARCIAANGWTDADAVRLAADPNSHFRIVCGIHRDESWEIVARLRPSLTDRCTGVAIRKLVETAVTLDRYRREEKQRAALWPADTLETDGGLWVSEQMTELLSIARRIAPSDVTVLLTGETGTGKEVLARAIHRASPRSARPFVPFNCTAVPRDMLDSQLFGYRRGAFTGADSAFEGVIRAAAGGTLFLDEIAEIGPERAAQAAALPRDPRSAPPRRDRSRSRSTSASSPRPTPTSKRWSPKAAFREDLFYRLNVVRLRLPPLRERREEIPPLIDHYLRRVRRRAEEGPADARRRDAGVPAALPVARQRPAAGQRDAAAWSRSPTPTAPSRRRCSRPRSRRRAAP